MKDRGMENVLFDTLKEEKYVDKQSAKLNFIKTSALCKKKVKNNTEVKGFSLIL